MWKKSEILYFYNISCYSLWKQKILGRYHLPFNLVNFNKNMTGRERPILRGCIWRIVVVFNYLVLFNISRINFRTFVFNFVVQWIVPHFLLNKRAIFCRYTIGAWPIGVQRFSVLLPIFNILFLNVENDQQKNQ